MIEGNEVNAADLSIASASARTGSSEGTDGNFTLLEGVERNAIVQMLKEPAVTTRNRQTPRLGPPTLYKQNQSLRIEV